MLFEAVTYRREVSKGRVVPDCYQLGIAEVPFPLSQFQGSRRGPGGYLQIARIDKWLVRQRTLPADQLMRTFERWWPDLEVRLAEVSC